VGKVKRRLFINNKSERIAIFGLGGVGKTQISLELAYQTRELYPDCAIFWIPAVDMESLQHAYRTVADQLGIVPDNPKEDVKYLVKSHLSDPSAGRWLLIFDNADEVNMWIESEDSTTGRLREYLPASDQGAIVFTTRSNKVAQYLAGTDIIEIPEMDEHKATDVLRNSLVEKELLQDINSTRQLLSRLTFLPLAIVQAASFINENRMTLSKYVELLDGQEQSAIDLLAEDFEDKGRYKSIRNPVATTWLTSFEQIQRQNPLAADYLCFMACVKEKDILISFFPPASDVDRQRAIGVLSSYSFVRTRNDNSRLDMHRLVHLATRNWLQSVGSLRGWQLHVLNCLAANYPLLDQLNRSQWRAAIPHALQILRLTASESQLPARPHVLDAVARCQMEDGRYREAEELFSEALEISETLYGPETPYTLYVRTGLAGSYSVQGKSAKAIKLSEEILEKITSIYGPESLEATRALYHLSRVYRDIGNHHKAQELCRRAIPQFLRALGPGAPETMDAIFTLIMTYISYGQFSDATELSLQSLDINKKVVGTDHPRTIGIMIAMARMYMEQWRLKEAEALLAEALGIQKRTYGPEHPETINTMVLLARAWEYRGQRKKAIAMRTECIRISNQLHGSDHFVTARFRAELEELTNPK
jgi:tetratricopeptide (TPR) repeat protein